ncbi:MAG TPA: penicillin-binding transpeptidase domain-containing protein [Solirubrobacteraceae bacterium]|nr:penicillin-binding transpeptidase domain-containing protein [Solirubrobacteraceae bacterium]
MTDTQRQRLRRARPVLALATVSFLVGLIVGANHGASPSVALASRFVQAWSKADYASMYAEISPSAQRAVSPSAFAGDYEADLRTATAERRSVAGRARSLGSGRVAVPVRVRTRLWGTLSLTYEVRTVEVEGSERVAWTRSAAFPGVPAGQTLTRRTTLPRRATLLARDGSMLAESPPEGQSGSRATPLGEVGRAVVGEVGTIPDSRRHELEAEGVPPEAEVGVSGLERALDDRLRGTPGGELLAGPQALASRSPKPARAVRSTVSPAVQQAAVTALGGQLGGVVAMKPGTGEILAVAGIGLEGLQPPGSTFKIVTLSGALSAHLATPHSVFPYATYATLDGVKLNNANGEDCGGSLELAFAASCNSVFTPLGVKLGAARLVAMAEKFGFNHDPGLPGAARSTLPAASSIQGELDVGSTAIGQGEVLATPLQMLIVGATIADGGRRPAPSFVMGSQQHATRAVSASVARTVRHMMTEVVREGTGTSAAIPGVVVAGKTGTAELKSACTSGEEDEAHESEQSETSNGEGCQGGESNASNTDAWFTAFAPAIHPKIAVAVMLVKDGAGGDTAAPVARQVLETGLK